VVLVVDAIELGFEVLRNVHLDDIDIRHGLRPPCLQDR
jgi:hypothetical protein